MLSSPAAVVLVATTVAVLALLFGALKSTARTGMWMLAGIPILLAYVVVPGVLAYTGRISRYDPLPAPALMIVAALTVTTVVLAFGPLGLRFATGVSLAWLVGYQVFRVAVEWMLHRLYLDGVVPAEMTYAGRNFDVISGLTAVLVAGWIVKGGAPRLVVLAWNIMGLALLLNIVVVAVLATPVPFRHFTSGPPNLLPSTFPYVWLPTVLVQAALFGHLVVFRALRARR